MERIKEVYDSYSGNYYQVIYETKDSYTVQHINPNVRLKLLKDSGYVHLKKM